MGCSADNDAPIGGGASETADAGTSSNDGTGSLGAAESALFVRVSKNDQLVSVVARHLGDVFGIAGSLSLPAGATDPKLDTGPFGTQEVESATLLFQQQDSLRFGVTRMSPALGDVTIEDDLVLVNVQALDPTCDNVSLERVVVRRASGEFVFPATDHCEAQ